MSACASCGGSGWNYAHTIMCLRCDGTGRVDDDSLYERIRQDEEEDEADEWR